MGYRGWEIPASFFIVDILQILLNFIQKKITLYFKNIEIPLILSFIR